MNHPPLIYAASPDHVSNQLADALATKMGAERRHLIFKTFKDDEMEVRLCNRDRDEVVGERVILVGDAKTDREQAAVEDVLAGFNQGFFAACVDVVVRRTCDQGHEVASACLARGKYRRRSLLAKRPNSLTIIDPTTSDSAEAGVGGIIDHLRQDEILQQIFKTTKKLAPNALMIDGPTSPPPLRRRFLATQETSPVVMSTEKSEYFAALLAEKMKLPLHQIIRREKNSGRSKLEPLHPNQLMGRPAFVVGGTETERDQGELEDLLWGLRDQIGMGPLYAVQPYQGYGTAERMILSRDGEGGWTFPRGVYRQASLLEDVRPDAVTLFDLHAEGTMHVGGRAGRPDLLYGEKKILAILESIQQKYGPENVVLVAPDLGRAPLIRSWSEKSGINMMGLRKVRSGTDEVHSSTQDLDMEALKRELKGKVCLMGDDLLRTGGTALTQEQICQSAEAKAVIFIGSHAELPGDSEKRLDQSTFTHFHVMNTHSRTQTIGSPKFTVHDVTDLFAERLSKYL